MRLSVVFAGVMVLGLLAFASAVVADDKPAAQSEPRLKALQAHVEHLAGAELMGRGDWTHRQQAADYVAKGLADAGLVPVPGMETMFQDHDVPAPFDKARNVVAWLPGKQAGKTKEAPGKYVIVSAHFDHLGSVVKASVQSDGSVATEIQVFHGADDNASGVAALLEIARLLAAEARGGNRPDRSVVFVAFDLEERGLIGSRKYVEASPLPLSDLEAFVTIDQLGRSIADVVPGGLFLMGTENSTSLRAALDTLAPPPSGIVLPLGIDFQPGYSDYEPFKDARIPYVFVTSGACGDYHLITDVADRIQWAHLVERTAYCLALVKRIADGRQAFTWHDEPVFHPEEMKRLGEVLKDVSEHLEERGLPIGVKIPLDNFRAQIDAALEDGEVTIAERTQLRNMALLMFKMAGQMQSGG